MRCNAETAYLCELDIYLGNRSSQPSENGLGYNLVRRLSQHLENKYYLFFFDDYFSSVPLMTDLQENGLHACGTVRNNRKGYSQTLKRLGSTKQGRNLVAI